MLRLLLALALSSSALASRPALAQPVVEAPPIEVVDRPEGPAQAPPSAFATRVTLDRAQAEGRSVADVLETLPGLHVRRFGGLGAFATLSIRGSSATQVQVLV